MESATPFSRGDEDSIYATPATHIQSSAYATPATDLAKSARIRFDSEEPVSATPTTTRAMTAQTLGQTPLEVADAGHLESASDDDEAPEAITNITATKSARALDVEASRAAAAQRAAVRTKRKQRDDTLRAQAEGAEHKGRKRKRTGQTSLDDQSDRGEDDDVEEITRDDLDDGNSRNPRVSLSNLPALLPQELLDAAPEVRPLSPPPLSPPAVDKNPDKLALLDKRRTKDVKRGPVKVRVLEGRNVLLPPKADKAIGTMRQTRDAWMMGRPGAKGKLKGIVGTGRVERRHVGVGVGGRGFLRKQL